MRSAVRPGARVHVHGRGFHTRAEGRQAEDVETGRVETGGPETRAGGGARRRAVHGHRPAAEVGHRRGDQRIHQLLAQGLAAVGLSVRPRHSH